MINTGDELISREEAKKKLEGPISLRILALLGGLAMTAFGTWSLIYVMDIFKHMAKYIVQIYITVGGLSIILIELKDRAATKSMQDWFDRWMPFLTTMLGKGIFYNMCGTLCMSLWTHNYYLLGTGVYMCALGILLCLLYMGKCSSYDQYFRDSRYNGDAAGEFGEFQDDEG